MPWTRALPTAFIALNLLAIACQPESTATSVNPCEAVEQDFEDHTAGCITSLDEFFALSGSRVGSSVVKFNVMAFPRPEDRHVRYLDSTFYRFHDEWYYFRLLNGQDFEGDEAAEPYPGQFASVADIYEWAYTQGELPLDLQWSRERLLASRFYDLYKTEPRTIGPGVVIHFPPGATKYGELWAFEILHGDNIEYAELVVYFETLAASLPAEIADRIVWLTRSPEQAALAQTMRDQGLAYHQRVLDYGDLIEPGVTEIYNPGLTAGRLKIVRSGEPTPVDRDDYILLLEEIPDHLPPAHALVTSVPQTPLAHINLLAQSRGIPNASVGDIINDPRLDQLARVRAYVALRARPGQPLELVEISREAYKQWQQLGVARPKAVPHYDFRSAPLTIDLAELEPEQFEALRPLIGGKAAGMLRLMNTPGVTHPDTPLVITAKAYAEHIEASGANLAAMLATDTFLAGGSPKLRRLVLEGEASYDQFFQTPLDQRDKLEFLRARGPGDPLHALVVAGGLRAVIERHPIATATIDTLHAELQAHFAAFAPYQGIRLRSSSSVEDIEGFNGAGLYESHTAYLNRDPRDPKRGLETSLKQVWSSYWSSEAFEERASAAVVHLTGHMAVLAHARFDDSHERLNGVLTLTRWPAHAGQPIRHSLVFNSQRGSESVTNPSSQHLPEHLRAEAIGDTLTKVERLRESTLPPEGTPVLSPAQIQQLFDQGHRVAEAWLSQINTALPAREAQRTLSLDFEYRDMAPGWPALASDDPGPARLILKQARSLDPDVHDLDPKLRELGFPRDVLARAAKIRRVVCDAGQLQLTVVEALTDAFAVPDLGHSIDAFVATAHLEVLHDLAGIDLAAGSGFAWNHTAFAAHHPQPSLDIAAWNLDLHLHATGQGEAGLARLQYVSGGTWQLTSDSGQGAMGAAATCTAELLHADRDTFLADLIDAAD